MEDQRVSLSVGYFPPYEKYYVSSDSHVDDYLSWGEIHRKYPTYYDTFEQAKAAKDEYIKKHPERIK